MIRNPKNIYHTSVLLKEAVDGLDVRPDRKYVDATLGGGGHTQLILERGGKVLGIDIDVDAINYVQEKFKGQSASWRTRFKLNKDIFLERGNFADLRTIALKHGFSEVSGILFDLGVSGHQLESSDRGFSFKYNAPLDMRMDQAAKITAADIINRYTKEELYEIFSKFSEELDSWSLADTIIRARTLKPINNTHDLVDIIRKVKGKSGKIHQATTIFQALRIAVNSELDNLATGLSQAHHLLKGGGRLVVISFHSLEDRIVKLYCRKHQFMEIIKKPITASWEELKINPRSRSAKLRIFKKLI